RILLTRGISEDRFSNRATSCRDRLEFVRRCFWPSTVDQAFRRIPRCVSQVAHLPVREHSSNDGAHRQRAEPPESQPLANQLSACPTESRACGYQQTLLVE